MKKYEYIRATLTLKPTRKAAAQMKNARASIRGPLTGTLDLTNWHDKQCTILKVAGSLEPKTTLTKPKKAKAQRARKERER